MIWPEKQLPKIVQMMQALPFETLTRFTCKQEHVATFMD
jgi:hypothetical protein